MNVIFTCGGTAGHINPAIAVANIFRERHPGCKILFIGAKGKMEEQLVPQAGYELKCLPASGLSRAKSIAGLKQNVHAVKCVLTAVSACRKIIREFDADVVVGTGGYASFPALYAAQSMGIPTCVHEANALPGLTTKLAARKADKTLVAFEESRAYYKNPDRVEVVGMPVRREFVYTDKAAAREKLGIGQDERVVVSAFGSLGAHRMNETVAELFVLEQKGGFPFRHIHATGKYGWEWMPGRVKELGVDLDNCGSIDMREYIYDMPDLMAAADVIISRAGASSCNEIGASGTPCILIPSPNVTNDHQTKNARVLAENGGAILLPEGECSAQKLMGLITGLLGDQQRMDRMSTALRSMTITDSADRICDMMEQLAKARA